MDTSNILTIVGWIVAPALLIIVLGIIVPKLKENKKLSYLEVSKTELISEEISRKIRFVVERYDQTINQKINNVYYDNEENYNNPYKAKAIGIIILDFKNAGNKILSGKINFSFDNYIHIIDTKLLNTNKGLDHAQEELFKFYRRRRDIRYEYIMNFKDVKLKPRQCFGVQFILMNNEEEIKNTKIEVHSNEEFTIVKREKY